MPHIEKTESASLIASNKIEGTSVFDYAGERLGSIYNLMVDKRSGQVEYAVLQFGGVLGLGSDYYPLPWDMLRYDAARGGYVVALSKEVFQDAPHFAPHEEPDFTPSYHGEIYDAYGLYYPGAFHN